MLLLLYSVSFIVSINFIDGLRPKISPPVNIYVSKLSDKPTNSTAVAIIELVPIIVKGVLGLLIILAIVLGLLVLMCYGIGRCCCSIRKKCNRVFKRDGSTAENVQLSTSQDDNNRDAVSLNQEIQSTETSKLNTLFNNCNREDEINDPKPSIQATG